MVFASPAPEREQRPQYSRTTVRRAKMRFWSSTGIVVVLSWPLAGAIGEPIPDCGGSGVPLVGTAASLFDSIDENFNPVSMAELIEGRPLVLAVSDWGVVVMTLVVLSVGTLVFMRQRPVGGVMVFRRFNQKCCPGIVPPGIRQRAGGDGLPE